MTIDTLSYVKRLEAAGVPRTQAEAHAEALRDEITPQVATKLDLTTETTIIRGDIKALEDRMLARMDAMMARMDAMMLRQSVAIILAVLAAGSFIVRFLR